MTIYITHRSKKKKEMYSAYLKAPNFIECPQTNLEDMSIAMRDFDQFWLMDELISK